MSMGRKERTNKKIIAISVLIAILFVSAIAGTIFYYEGKVNISNSKIASLSNQVANQDSEIANLKSIITQFNSEAANLSTHLKVSEVTNGTSPSQPEIVYLNGTLAYDALSINGTVINTGNLTAHNAGLKIVAYSADGTLEINMTVPLVAGYLAYNPLELITIGSNIIYYGTDTVTQAYANVLDNFYGNENPPSLKLGDLGGGQTALVGIEIIHEGIVANWTVTAVWINSS